MTLLCKSESPIFVNVNKLHYTTPEASFTSQFLFPRLLRGAIPQVVTHCSCCLKSHLRHTTKVIGAFSSSLKTRPSIHFSLSTQLYFPSSRQRFIPSFPRRLHFDFASPFLSLHTSASHLLLTPSIVATRDHGASRPSSRSRGRLRNAVWRKEAEHRELIIPLLKSNLADDAFR